MQAVDTNNLTRRIESCNDVHRHLIVDVAVDRDKIDLVCKQNSCNTRLFLLVLHDDMYGFSGVKRLGHLNPNGLKHFRVHFSVDTLLTEITRLLA